MREIGAGDDHGIAQARCGKRGGIGKSLHAFGAFAQSILRPIQRSFGRVGKRSNLRTRRDRQVLDMLDTHHASAYQAVANSFCQCSSPV